MTYAYRHNLLQKQEVSTMSIKPRHCLIVVGLVAVAALYGSACWRVELLRSQPTASSTCVHDHCVPHAATLSALR